MNTKGNIAPHEGREIALVREGSKPLAVIEERKDGVQFALLEGGRKGLTIQERFTVGSGWERIIVRSGDEYLIDIYRAACGLPESPSKHRIMGYLFGYSKADIEAFIANPPECDCDKCRGGAEVAA